MRVRHLTHGLRQSCSGSGSLLSRRPDAADHLESLIDLLSQPEHAPLHLATQSFPTDNLIPLVGSTAAGMARFWEGWRPRLTVARLTRVWNH
ncbi:MAG: hypothetical protein R3C02_04230 [Planctomycetaceae bacterium]